MGMWSERLHGAREQGAGTFRSAKSGEEEGGVVEPD